MSLEHESVRQVVCEVVLRLVLDTLDRLERELHHPGHEDGFSPLAHPPTETCLRATRQAERLL